MKEGEKQTERKDRMAQARSYTSMYVLEYTHTQPHTPTLQTYLVITLSSPPPGGCAEGQAEDGDSVWMLCDAILDRVEQSHAAQGKEQ
jgi:hypothetical protein